MKKYTVIGNIGSTIIKNRPFTNNEDITIIVRDIWNEEQPPVMLTVIGSFQKYIKELTGHDYKKSITKNNLFVNKNEKKNNRFGCDVATNFTGE